MTRRRDRARRDRRLRSERSGDRGVPDAQATASATTRSSSTRTRSGRAHRRAAVPREPRRRHERRDRRAARAGRVRRDRPSACPQLGGCPSRPPAANYPPAGGPAGARCSTVLNYGFKRDLNQYIHDHLQTQLPDSVARTTSSRSTPRLRRARSTIRISRSSRRLFDISPGSADTLRYQRIARRTSALARRDRRGLERSGRRAGHRGRFRRDAVLGQQRRRHTGQSRISQHRRAGRFLRTWSNPPSPAGSTPSRAAGVTFSGRAFSEPRLIGARVRVRAGDAHRVPPASAPPLPSDTVIKH